MKKLEEYVTSIPDFPQKGIIFRDITSILQDADGLQLAIDSLEKFLEGVDFDVIAGTESRGFIFGVPVAYNLHKPFVPVRKKGKLPRETVSQTYDLEYGSATIEMHKDAIKPGDRVVLVDDLMATGGTIEAAAKLVEQLGCFWLQNAQSGSLRLPVVNHLIALAGIKKLTLPAFNFTIKVFVRGSRCIASYWCRNTN